MRKSTESVPENEYHHNVEILKHQSVAQPLIYGSSWTFGNMEI